MPFNYGAGIGGFGAGLLQGLGISQRFHDMKKEGDAYKVREEAMEAAKAEQAAATEAKTAALMGIGQPGMPQATETPGVTTAAVDIGNPQGAQLAEQAPTGPAVAAPAAPNAAAAAPTAGDQPRMVPAKFSPREGLGAPAAPANPANPGEQTTTEMSIGMAPTAERAGQAPVTRDAAAAQAKKTVPTVLEFFQKSGVPRITEHYLKTGDMEKAQAWQKYAEDAETQRNVKTWAKAYRAVETGNWEAAGEHIMDLYGKYDDGVTPISRELVKDKDGTVTGFNVKLKNDATGETRSSFVPTSDMATLGLQALSPGQMFEAKWKQKTAADAATVAAQKMVGEYKLKAALSKVEENQRQTGRIALADRKNEHELDQIHEKGAVDAKNAGVAEQAKIAAKTEAFRKAGYNDDFINGALPELLGVGEYKKRTSPEETRRLLMTARMADYSFQRKSAEEQRKDIDNDMKIIYNEQVPSGSSSAKSPGSSGIGKPSSPKSGKGTPFLDTKTGQVVYR